MAARQACVHWFILFLSTHWFVLFSSPVIHLSSPTTDLSLSYLPWPKLSSLWYSVSCQPTCPTTISSLHRNTDSAPATQQKPLCSLSPTISFPAWTAGMSLFYVSSISVNASMSFLTLCSFPNSSFTVSTRPGFPPTSPVTLSLSASPPLPATERFPSLFRIPWVSSRDPPLVPPLVPCCSPSSPTTSACTRRGRSCDPVR